jgi:protein-disulfide isomerase
MSARHQDTPVRDAMNAPRIAVVTFSLLLAAQLSAASQSNNIAATVHCKPITQDQLDERAASDLRQLNLEVFEVKQRALNSLIDERLLTDEATDRKLEVTQLLDQEVESKVSAPTSSEIDAYYLEIKSQVNRPLEEIRSQIAELLTVERRRTRYENYLKQLRSAARIVVMLDPPRSMVPIDRQRVRGPANAPITIVEFSDFECPFCGEVEETLRKLITNYPSQIRLAYRDFPLPFHPHASLAAQASRCASAQGTYWMFHDLLFANQQNLAIGDLSKFASGLALDANKFDDCLKNKPFAEDIQNDIRIGQGLGITGTPAFFINGIALNGAVSYEEFSSTIDQELDRLKRLRAAPLDPRAKPSKTPLSQQCR